MRVLPAPVSPVRTFSPGSNSRSRSWMTPRSVTWSWRSTGASYPRRATRPHGALLLAVSFGVSRQSELVPDPREERLPVATTDEADGAVRGADPDPGTDRRPHALTSVGGHQ